ncbi:sensor histidine kinase [Cohnella thailandensis]|uniref:histidine kinase n=1 Tax=Cohnella thailandensis TaxID=557557 RepID=A0A841T819_9BACL|nr:ATP-binding protein [Cohnella thailandensis]MBB6637997.1 HAMP domain-containing protein [Cohnella thailandensis]MBP1976863.1 signal transduction histidine kinase [Cohnella thailandensis]
MRIPWQRSIAFRLFVVTFVVIMLFVGLLLAALAGGFSSFYERRQKSDILEEIGRTAAHYRAYESTGGALTGMPPFITRFESEYYSKIALLTIEDGAVTTVLMSGAQQKKQVFLKGDNIDEEGPVKVPIDSEMILVPDLSVPSELEDMMVAVKVWVQNEGSFRAVIGEGRTIVYSSRGDSTETLGAQSPQLIAVTPISSDGNRSGEVMLAVASLQPVTHAASVFKDLSVYVLGAALVFVLLLAVGYATIVTKPLIRLNALAERLAGLDFGARARWKRKDEIGALAGSLDFLADNLQMTLGELQAANEKLREDIEKEKRLERMRRQFIAGVSHELKTPLSLIGGYAEGLKDNIGSGAKREKYAEVILDETRRMSAIVSDMLELSHLESGQYSLTLEAFDLTELLREAAERAEALGSEKSLTISVIFPQGDSDGTAEAAEAIGDRLRIGQVLTNLVTNAVRHATDGGRIAISAAQDGDHWLIEVYNDGEPIPQEELPRIWGDFYRVDKARSRESGGTGIGLAIVRQILTLHGSRYGVRNETGGVTFGFTLRSSRGMKPAL